MPQFPHLYLLSRCVCGKYLNYQKYFGQNKSFMNVSWYQLLLYHKLGAFQGLRTTNTLPGGDYIFTNKNRMPPKTSEFFEIFSECVESLPSQDPNPERNTPQHSSRGHSWQWGNRGYTEHCPTASNEMRVASDVQGFASLQGVTKQSPVLLLI